MGMASLLAADRVDMFNAKMALASCMMCSR